MSQIAFFSATQAKQAYLEAEESKFRNEKEAYFKELDSTIRSSAARCQKSFALEREKQIKDFHRFSTAEFLRELGYKVDMKVTGPVVVHGQTVTESITVSWA